MATWNYRLVKYKDGCGYGVHEVYYNLAGQPTDMTENPVGFTEDTPEQVFTQMETALKDARERPILDLDTFEWAEYDLDAVDLDYAHE